MGYYLRLLISPSALCADYRGVDEATRPASLGRPGHSQTDDCARCIWSGPEASFPVHRGSALEDGERIDWRNLDGTAEENRTAEPTGLGARIIESR